MTDVTGKGEGPNVGGGECVGSWTGVSHKYRTTLGAVASGVDVNIVKSPPGEFEDVAHRCRYGWQRSSAGNEPVHENSLLSDNTGAKSTGETKKESNRWSHGRCGDPGFFF